MKQFNKIAIIGVGLIGGSIGLAIKKRRIARQVIGVFRRKTTMRKALARKAVDRAFLDIRAGVRDADLIVIATQVSSIPRIACDVIHCAKSGAIITDAGSTKVEIVRAVERCLTTRPDVYFVGAHPMAGSEKTSVEASCADLCERAACLVTKTAKTEKKALAKVVSFWKSLGCKVTITTPSLHDRSVALVSHLPHFAAFGLAGTVPAQELRFAAEGFRDTTRIASSDAELWADIFFSNSKEVLSAVRAFESYCRKMAGALSRGDRKEFIKLLKAAKAKRDRLTHEK